MRKERLRRPKIIISDDTRSWHSVKRPGRGAAGASLITAAQRLPVHTHTRDRGKHRLLRRRRRRRQVTSRQKPARRPRSPWRARLPHALLPERRLAGRNLWREAALFHSGREPGGCPRVRMVGSQNHAARVFDLHDPSRMSSSSLVTGAEAWPCPFLPAPHLRRRRRRLCRDRALPPARRTAELA